MYKSRQLLTAVMQITFIGIFCGLGFSSTALSADGKSLYTSCAACHGQQAEGNPALGAPALAGLQDWYLKSQLEAFNQGRRGYKPYDTYGAQMRAAVKILPNAADRAAVSAYIAKMPPVKANRGKPADRATLANGSTQFNALCSSCHGSNGLGNQALGAPRLAGQNTAYLARQLAAFRNGQRGGMANDKFGKQMAIMSKLLPVGKAEQDTLAYIATLKP
jgi:cytochrome c oxidase subunit 2